MRIQDYDSVCGVTKAADIAAALNKRHGDGINSFWLSHLGGASAVGGAGT